MVHYALMKFHPGAYTDEIRALTKSTFEELPKVVPAIIKAETFENCYERDSNADLMIRVEVDEPAHLPDYLNHPLHVHFAQVTTPLRCQPITSFDHL